MDGPARLYVDHAATTPVRPEVLAAMLPHLEMRPGNASSLHSEGRRARAALDGARTAIARLLGAAPREIVFLGGGSEADNLAVLGVARARKMPGAHVVTVATEHPAVLRAVELLEDEGFAVTILPVDRNGLAEPRRFAEALRPQTVLASVMLANNELGTVAPVAELARLARERGVTFHTDAVAAAGKLPLRVDTLGVDLLSLSAHKLYGPQGVGALFVRRGTPLAPLAVGGGQEAGRRSGTENIAGVVGLATALELAVAEQPAEAARLCALRERFEAALRERIPGCRVNAAEAHRLPNITSATFADTDAPALAVGLDLAGAAVSAASACASGASAPSHVIAALGAPPWPHSGTIRFSFGKLTGEQDVEPLARMVQKVVAQARDANDDLGTLVSGSSTGRSEVRS